MHLCQGKELLQRLPLVITLHVVSLLEHLNSPFTGCDLFVPHKNSEMFCFFCKDWSADGSALTNYLLSESSMSVYAPCQIVLLSWMFSFVTSLFVKQMMIEIIGCGKLYFFIRPITLCPFSETFKTVCLVPGIVALFGVAGLHFSDLTAAAAALCTTVHHWSICCLSWIA